MTRELKFIEVKSELGAGTRGASLGIDALKIASLNKKNDVFADYLAMEVPVYNRIL